tara:strand:- start:17645 stop:18379 length:735 start_codon:yes stop_codon:yes gene_type:complete
MAVSVDTVYQRVLALANKEQRGYITPQEYNLLANQAQMAIFESYFYHKNAREIADANKSNEIDETNISELLSRKLNPFSEFLPVTSGHTFPANTTVNSVAYPIFQYGTVMLGDEPCQKVSMFDAERLKKSIRHMASTAGQAPFYTDNRVSGRDIVVYAGSTQEETSNVTVECFRIPVPVVWAYVVVNEKALYNANAAVDFELHRSEEDTLVYKILELAGIVMNKTGLTTTVSQLAAGEQQFQNQ